MQIKRTDGTIVYETHLDGSAIALPAPMAVRHVRDPRGGVQL